MAKLLIAVSVSITFLGNSCRIKGISPQEQPYERILSRVPLEEREKILKLLEEGSKISQARHQKQILKVVQAFKDWYQNDPTKGALIVLSNEDFTEYKNMNFKGIDEILWFMRTRKEKVNIYVSESNVLMVEHTQFSQQNRILYKFCLDYEANGMHEGEEDYVYSSGFSLRKAMKPSYEWSFEFEKKVTELEDLLRRDLAINAYRVAIQRAWKMLENRTNLGYLIVRYTLDPSTWTDGP